MFELYRGLDRTILLKKLQPGIRYTVRVKAINCIGESPFSAPASYTTQASVPCVPDEPALTSSGPDSVVLRWLPVGGNGAEVSGYQVEIDDGQGGEFSFVGHSHEPHFSVAGLRSGLAYKFRVRAENAEGKSLWSPVCVARTAATPPLAPAPPVKTGSTNSSVAVNWQPPEVDGGSAITKYEVEMQPKCPAARRDLPNEWFRTYEGEDLGCTLGALRAGCTYRVRVRAVNAQGPGVYSFPADVATSPANPEAPGCPAAAARAQDSLAVRWAAPPHDGGTPVTAYRLECRAVGPVEPPRPSSAGPPAPEEPVSYNVVYEGPELQAEVPGLAPGVRYQFRVAAANKQGASPWSAAGEVETKPGTPLPPDAPAILYGAAPRSLQLRWVPPYGRGAPVDSYIVQLRLVDAAAAATASAGSAAPKAANGGGDHLAAAEDLSGAGNAEHAANGEPGGQADAGFATVYHGSDPQCTSEF